MKRRLVLIGTGFGLFVLVMLAELVVTLPLPLPGDAERPAALLLEFALTAPCALVLSFVLGWVLRLPDAPAGVRVGLLWAGIVAALYLLIALANDTLWLFGVPTIYLMFACVAAGAALAGAWAGRRAGASARR